MERIRALLLRMGRREREAAVAILLLVFILLAKTVVLEEVSGLLAASRSMTQIENEIAKGMVTLKSVQDTKPQNIRSSPLWAYRAQNEGLGGFLRKISYTGETRRDFSVRKIASEKTDRLPEYDRTKLELEVEGPFQSIGSFLEEIESSQLLTRIESVQVFRMEKELRLCRAKILVNSYSWRDQ